MMKFSTIFLLCLCALSMEMFVFTKGRPQTNSDIRVGGETAGVNLRNQSGTVKTVPVGLNMPIVVNSRDAEEPVESNSGGAGEIEGSNLASLNSKSQREASKTSDAGGLNIPKVSHSGDAEESGVTDSGDAEESELVDSGDAEEPAVTYFGESDEIPEIDTGFDRGHLQTNSHIWEGSNSVESDSRDQSKPSKPASGGLYLPFLPTLPTMAYSGEPGEVNEIGSGIGGGGATAFGEVGKAVGALLGGVGAAAKSTLSGFGSASKLIFGGLGRPVGLR